MLGICCALKEIVCCHSFFPVMIRRQKCGFWSVIMLVESAEATRHPCRCQITIDGVGYAGLRDVGSVGVMAARPYDKKGTECKDHFDPLGG